MTNGSKKFGIEISTEKSEAILYFSGQVPVRQNVCRLKMFTTN